jgi:hypothetical protein
MEYINQLLTKISKLLDVYKYINMTSSNESLVVRVQGQSKLVKEQLPLPAPNIGQVQVKVSHVAQNPTDGIL